MERRSPLRRKTPLKPGLSGLRGTPLVRKAPKQQQGWAKAVEAVIERSGNRCELRIQGICTGRGEQTDHVLNRSQGGKADPDLLRRTCVPCHRFKTEHPKYAYEHGLSIHNWDDRGE